jgi:hypothetical protein
MFRRAVWERVTDVSEAVDTTHPRVLTLHQCRCETRSHTKETTQKEATRQHVPEDDMRCEEGKVTVNRSSYNEGFHDLYFVVRMTKSRMIKWKENVASKGSVKK